MGGPTGNILCSLRFWAHFQWTVCGKAQIRFLNAPLPCWLTVPVFVSVSLWPSHLHCAVSQTMYSWAHRLSGNLQVESSDVHDATTNACFWWTQSMQFNCVLFLSSEKQINWHVKIKRKCCWCILCNTQFKYFLEMMAHKQLSSWLSAMIYYNMMI